MTICFICGRHIFAEHSVIEVLTASGIYRPIHTGRCHEIWIAWSR